MIPTVIVLTFNSAESIRSTLLSIRRITDDIRVVDSGSSDGTLDIALEFGAVIYRPPFLNYGNQRNWAIANIVTKYPWQLHLDADERLSDELCDEILSLPEENIVADGFFIQRYLMFMGRLLRHNLAPTWHMRLFRSGMGQCEQREYDQHFLCTGTTGRLRGEMIDDIGMPLADGSVVTIGGPTPKSGNSVLQTRQEELGLEQPVTLLKESDSSEEDTTGRPFSFAPLHSSFIGISSSLGGGTAGKVSSSAYSRRCGFGSWWTQNCTKQNLIANLESQKAS